MSETAVAVINAAALRNNLNQIRQAAPGCKVMAAVKADGYGHGLLNVATVLSDADAFGVARVEEGVQLRDAGITQSVVVLEGVADAAEIMLAVEHGLELVVHDSSQFEYFQSVPNGILLNVWLKLDTGMGRLGFAPADFAAAMERLQQLSPVAPAVRVMTHFSSADEPENDFTRQQIEQFGQAIGKFSGDVSLANSGGIFQWPESLVRGEHLDYSGENWVRPGISLYGASPVQGKPASAFGLRPVMTFKSRLIAIKECKAGETVGYGRDWRATSTTRIGVVAVGYGDGYPRHIAAGTPVAVAGEVTTVIGRVSMDMITVDLSGCDTAAVNDEVVLWGGVPSVDEVAACAETISYDLFCGLSQRTRKRLVNA